MAVAGPRHPLKDVHEAGRVRAAGLVSSAGAVLQEHSAACAVVLGVASVVWGLVQVS
jgi:hypothetical protein